MNDFLKAMSQFGMENIISDEHTVTLEEEMNEEIAMEAELDDAHYQMDCANIVASTSQCEAILTAMAEREIGLESNENRDPSTVYSEFGLEAVKDVAMRKVYSGIANIKALINTCINWLKQLVGIHTASKKILSGLAKKAKAMKKLLSKVQSKQMTEKLSREIPKFSEIFKKLMSEMKYDFVYMREGKLGDTRRSLLEWYDDKKHTERQSKYKEEMDEIEKKLEDIDDLFDKDDTNEYEGSACYNKIVECIKALEKNSTDTYAKKDMIKPIDDCIKDLEKLRKEIYKKDNEITSPEGLSKSLNMYIKGLTKLASYRKKLLKIYVRCADDCLTMAKGIYAALV